MDTTAFRPGRDEFIRLAAAYPVVPVWIEVLADRETPVSIYETLVGDRPGFLLESVEGGEAWARWSFAGWDPEFTLVARDGVCSIEGGAGVEVPDGDPMTVLDALIGRYRTPDLDGLPPLHSGAVGFLGYDTVRYVEHLPGRPPDDRSLPEMVWQFVGSLAAFDRFRQSIALIRNVFVGDDPGAQYDEAVESLRAAGGSFDRPRSAATPVMPTFAATPTATVNLDQETYEDIVRKSVEYVHAGDVFQVVPSLRLEVDFPEDAFSAYRALRLVNPSPFMFLVRHPDVTVVGASPEVMTRVRDGVVYSRPIAGTRPRGANDDEDRRLEEELLDDPKERAEHVMLVDLARNDLGRVCEYGTVEVDELMVIERYSHVMHIVSGVSGKLRPGASAVDVLRATFPHGTVSGAPKVRAMEIIDELEPTARGPYAGAVGYIDFSGNVDTCIALRTMVLADGKAWVQAGAGVVADSDPGAEYRECLAKAAAVLAAIEERAMSDVTAEYLALRDGAGLVTGMHEIVWVRGADALGFLDGLLTQDIAAIPEGGVARSLLLAPQGKLRATLWVLRGDDEVGLITDTGYGTVVATDLGRFKIRVAATIDETATPMIEVWGPESGAVLSAAGLPVPPGWARADGLVVRCPLGALPRYLVSGVEPDLLLAAGAVATTDLPVTSVRIEAGEPLMGVDIDEKTIPQEAGLVVDTVSFTKGCYLGQELVARIDSRGRVNRHLRGVQITINVIPPQGAAVSLGDTDVGHIGSVGESLVMRAPVGLALLRREAAPGDEVTVRWDGGTAPAVVRELPFDDFAGS